MIPKFVLRCAAGAFLGIVPLAGCAGVLSGLPSADAAGNGKTTAGARIHGWLSPGYKKNVPLLYLSDGIYGTVSVYDVAQTPPRLEAQLEGFAAPDALWVDALGDLYVENYGLYDVYEFKPGQTNPFATLVDLDGLPSAVCGDSQGNVYLPHTNSQTISVFSRGAIWPTSTLTDTHATHFDYCTVDSSGNLFVTYAVSPTRAAVDEFVAGSKQPKTLVTQLKNEATGIAIDAAADLYVSDDINDGDDMIETFAPPYGNSPQSSFKFDGFGGEIAVDAPASNLWSASNGAVTQFSLPSGKIEQSIAADFARGVALGPGAL